MSLTELQRIVDANEVPVLLEAVGTRKEILVVTLNRPEQANSIPSQFHNRFDELWTHFEASGQFRVAILTGKGKFFSAGADLSEWLTKADNNGELEAMRNGFLGISDRSNKKPIIAALNGSSYGGGTETLLNCDLVVALRTCTIALPEVRVGVTAVAGALPRLGRLLTLQQANELALIGEPIPAEKAHAWGIVNRLADTPAQVLEQAIALAEKICLGSPEGVFVSHRGVRRGYEETHENLKQATAHIADNENHALIESENLIEGLLAFKDRRKPNWKQSKL